MKRYPTDSLSRSFPLSWSGLTALWLTEIVEFVASDNHLSTLYTQFQDGLLNASNHDKRNGLSYWKGWLML